MGHPRSWWRRQKSRFPSPPLGMTKVWRGCRGAPSFAFFVKGGIPRARFSWDSVQSPLRGGSQFDFIFRTRRSEVVSFRVVLIPNP